MDFRKIDKRMSIYMKKAVAVLISVLLLSAGLFGCSSDGTGAQIVFPVDLEPQYLDPQIVSENGAVNIVLNCYEGLVTYNEKGEIVPAGAESFDVSGDGLTYTFKLREDAKWKASSYAKKLFGDGGYDKFDNRVTAKDYVFAFERICDSETASPSYPFVSCVKNAEKVHNGTLSKESLGVRAEGDFTLVVELERKNSDFLEALTAPACVPCNEEFFELTKGRYCLSVANMLSNGPFYITNWADGTAITARQNDLYHSSVSPSSVYFSFNNEKKTRGEKVESGVYEFSPVSKSQAAALSKSKSVGVAGVQNSCFALLFNCSGELLKNSDLRKAFAFSLDKSLFESEKAVEACAGIVPSLCLADSASYRQRVGRLSLPETDSQKAKEYLQSAKEKLGVKTIALSVLCSTENEMTVRKALQLWQSVFGVESNISVEAVDEATLEERIQSGDFSLAFSSVTFKSASALKTLGFFSQDSSENIFRFSSKKFESLLLSARSAENARVLLSLLKKAEQYLTDNAVMVPIYEEESFFASAKGVSGVVVSPGGEYVYFKNTVKK